MLVTNKKELNKFYEVEDLDIVLKWALNNVVKIWYVLNVAQN